MYQEIDIQLTEAALKKLFYGDRPTGVRTRKLMSRLDADHGIGLPSWFFGYAQDGQPDPGAYPRSAMFHAGDSLRLHAIGAQSCDVLTSKAALIQAALIRETGELLAAHARSGEHQLDASDFPIACHVQRLIVGKKTSKSFWWESARRVDAGETWLDVAGKQIAQVITQAIFDQCMFLFSCSDEVHGERGERLEAQYARMMSLRDPQEALDERHRMLEKFSAALGVCVTGVEGHTFYRASGPQGLHVMLKGVEFTMRATLSGVWMAGRNRIEGMGLIRQSTRRARTRPRELEFELDAGSREHAR